MAHNPDFASGCRPQNGVCWKPSTKCRSCGPSKGRDMANHISLRGFVSSDMEMSTTDNGLVIGKFRMGSNMRRLDPITNQWVDGQTNWFRVTAFRALASNTMISIRKGDRILVVGKLRVTSYLRKDGTPGTGVEIDADSIGPDLQFGIANYVRMTSSRPAGQGGDAQAAAAGGFSSTALEEGEFPDDQLDGESGQGGDDGGGADDDQAAAAMASQEDDGLEDGERADLETGEIVPEGVPY